MGKSGGMRYLDVLLVFLDPLSVEVKFLIDTVADLLCVCLPSESFAAVLVVLCWGGTKNGREGVIETVHRRRLCGTNHLLM